MFLKKAISEPNLKPLKSFWTKSSLGALSHIYGENWLLPFAFEGVGELSEQVVFTDIMPFIVQERYS